MSHPFDIAFDPNREDPGRAFLASIVLTPVDEFDGAIVTGPLTARIEVLGKTAIRSLSGHLAFERLESGRSYRVRIDPTRAGYFAPVDRVIPVPQPRSRPHEGPPVNDTGLVPLIRMPDFVREGEAMILRGAVTDADGAPIGGVLLDAEVDLFVDPDDSDPPQRAAPAAALPRFRTRTNGRGNFALRMRPPRVSLANNPRLPVTGLITLRQSGVPVWSGEIRDLATRVLPDPIQLS